MRSSRKPAAIALFGAAVLLLNFPLVGLADFWLVGGSVPALLWYLLLVWLLIIFSLYRLTRQREELK